MQHLTLEALARLVDEPAAPDEAAHLQHCGACRDELAGLAEQRAAFAALPATAPPPEQWAALRARLRREMLVRDDARGRRLSVGARPTWWRAAAAVALFLLGAAAGTAATHNASEGGAASAARQRPAPAAEAADPALALRRAEAAYLSALARYTDAAGASPTDAATRLAALEEIVSTTREALNRAPADAVINGYHLAALGQRQAALRQLVRTAEDPWF